MKNILDYSLVELQSWMKENKEPAFRAKQIFEWMSKGIYDFSGMKNIPNSLKEKISEEFEIYIPKIIKKYESQKDGTIKMLLEYKDGNIIESVIMRYSYGNSICVSTQVGCRMGCKFCASTLGGRVRNLTAGEILGEVLAGQQLLNDRISNIVLMGSGEPFDNYDNVMKFLELVNSPDLVNIGQRHITLSTCGIVPKIYEFADREMQVTLAISLHSTTDEKRKDIMPIANKYSIEEILEACRYYIKKTNRRVTFEYSLVSGVNDTPEDARRLHEILKGILCHINLIPINEIKENDFKKSQKQNVDKFEKILKNYGMDVTVRREMGSDIDAACGQLRKNFIESE